MPSLKQMNEVAILKQHSETRTKWISVLLLLFILGLIVFSLWLYYASINIHTIPQNVYDTRISSVFNRLFNTNKKKVFWLGADNTIGIQEKNNIMYSLKYDNLDDYYDVQVYYKDRYYAKCTNNKCLDGYISLLCSEKICVYVPRKRQIIVIDKKHLYDELRKYKNL